MYYFTLWFPDRYRARVVSLIALAVPVSGIIAGPVSAGIMTSMAASAACAAGNGCS